MKSLLLSVIQKEIMNRIFLLVTIIATLSACATSGRLKYSPVSRAELSVGRNIDEIDFATKDINQSIRFQNEPCDTLKLLNGEMIQGVIQMTGRETVRYKKCDDQNGGEYSVKIKNLISIHFSSGTILTYGADGEAARTFVTRPEHELEPEPDVAVGEAKLNSEKSRPKKDNTRLMRRLGWSFFISSFLILGLFILIGLSLTGMYAFPQMLIAGGVIWLALLIIGIILLIISRPKKWINVTNKNQP